MSTIRPIRIEGDLAYISLTRGYEAVIDAADVSLVEGHNWSAAIDSVIVYAVRGFRKDGEQFRIRLHQQIIGVKKGQVIDHKDGDGLNNRRSNLRHVTRNQNSFNQKTPKNNTSGYKGVSFNKKRGKWVSSIGVSWKKRQLGYYATAEDANAAYCKASAEFHGEFRRVS